MTSESGTKTPSARYGGERSRRSLCPHSVFTSLDFLSCLADWGMELFFFVFPAPGSLSASWSQLALESCQQCHKPSAAIHLRCAGPDIQRPMDTKTHGHRQTSKTRRVQIPRFFSLSSLFNFVSLAVKPVRPPCGEGRPHSDWSSRCHRRGCSEHRPCRSRRSLSAVEPDQQRRSIAIGQIGGIDHRANTVARPGLGCITLTDQIASRSTITHVM